MTRAIVIKTFGDPAITGPVSEGMARTIIPANIVELNELRAERDRLMAQKTLRNFGDDRRWQRTKRRLARKYGVKSHGKVYTMALGIYGLMCYVIGTASKRLSDWVMR